MKNRFRKALVWLTCAVMMMTLWTGTATAEEEKNTDFLGKPFPDFSVTDTEGKTFTLSEALKDHQAAMIVFWATWCGPCEREFPYLEEVYQKYGDRVAFIALNEEKRDVLNTALPSPWDIQRTIICTDISAGCTFPIPWL